MSPTRLLRRENRPLAVATVVALLAIAAVTVAIVFRTQDQNRIEQLTRSTHDSLCDFKHGLETRLELTQQFFDDIRAHRRPPISGISNADLQSSINAQRAALMSLDDLDCKEATP